ncbi:hypothetical protein [Desulfofarcimen acetoxidans]|uniref:hypothetical protein n=1 Tax=Desulfofarcimen acetoxidans TaxID=58138 RepID=UPI00019E5F5A|nr:hypothetical protein [Desulfofarcimen acetoxidans]
MRQKISELSNHIVVCEADGRKVIATLMHENIPFVAIEKTRRYLRIRVIGLSIYYRERNR